MYVKVQCLSKSSSTIHDAFHKTFYMYCLPWEFLCSELQIKKSASEYKLEITTGIT